MYSPDLNRLVSGRSFREQRHSKADLEWSEMRKSERWRPKEPADASGYTVTTRGSDGVGQRAPRPRGNKREQSAADRRRGGGDPDAEWKRGVEFQRRRQRCGWVGRGELRPLLLCRCSHDGAEYF